MTGTRAALHFRAVAFECEVERTSTDPLNVAGAMSRLLASYEPHATYDPPLATSIIAGGSYRSAPAGRTRAPSALAICGQASVRQAKQINAPQHRQTHILCDSPNASIFHSSSGAQLTTGSYGKMAIPVPRQLHSEV